MDRTGRHSVHSNSSSVVITALRDKIKSLEDDQGQKIDLIDPERFGAVVHSEQILLNRKSRNVRKVYMVNHRYSVGWVVDWDINRCMVCSSPFGWLLGRPKHHCRACGYLVCHSCSPFATAVPGLEEPRGSRVCKNCFGLKAIEKPESVKVSNRHSLSAKDLDAVRGDAFATPQSTTSSMHTGRHSISSVSPGMVISPRDMESVTRDTPTEGRVRRPNSHRPKSALFQSPDLLQDMTPGTIDKELEAFEREQMPFYEQDYLKMREFIPLDIYKTTIKRMVSQGLTEELATRIWNNKILWLIVTHKDDIRKIHLADFRSKYVAEGLDVMELRAVWYNLPYWDATNLNNPVEVGKAEWKAGFKSKMDNLVYKMHAGTLAPHLKRHSAYEECELKHLFDPTVPLQTRYERSASLHQHAVESPLDANPLDDHTRRQVRPKGIQRGTVREKTRQYLSNYDDEDDQLGNDFVDEEFDDAEDDAYSYREDRVPVANRRQSDNLYEDLEDLDDNLEPYSSTNRRPSRCNSAGVAGGKIVSTGVVNDRGSAAIKKSRTPQQKTLAQELAEEDGLDVEVGDEQNDSQLYLYDYDDDEQGGRGDGSVEGEQQTEEYNYTAHRKVDISHSDNRRFSTGTQDSFGNFGDNAVAAISPGYVPSSSHKVTRGAPVNGRSGGEDDEGLSDLEDDDEIVLVKSHKPSFSSGLSLNQSSGNSGSVKVNASHKQQLVGSSNHSVQSGSEKSDPTVSLHQTSNGLVMRNQVHGSNRGSRQSSFSSVNTPAGGASSTSHSGPPSLSPVRPVSSGHNGALIGQHPRPLTMGEGGPGGGMSVASSRSQSPAPSVHSTSGTSAAGVRPQSLGSSARSPVPSVYFDGSLQKSYVPSRSSLDAAKRPSSFRNQRLEREQARLERSENARREILEGELPVEVGGYLPPSNRSVDDGILVEEVEVRSRASTVSSLGASLVNDVATYQPSNTGVYFGASPTFPEEKQQHIVTPVNVPARNHHQYRSNNGQSNHIGADIAAGEVTNQTAQDEGEFDDENDKEDGEERASGSSDHSFDTAEEMNTPMYQQGQFDQMIHGRPKVGGTAMRGAKSHSKTGGKLKTAHKLNNNPTAAAQPIHAVSIPATPSVLGSSGQGSASNTPSGINSHISSAITPVVHTAHVSQAVRSPMSVTQPSPQHAFDASAAATDLAQAILSGSSNQAVKTVKLLQANRVPLNELFDNVRASHLMLECFKDYSTATSFPQPQILLDLLIESLGADINFQEHAGAPTLLHYMVRRKEEKLGRLLVERGASIFITDSASVSGDAAGSPLSLALGQRQDWLMDEFVQCGRHEMLLTEGVSNGHAGQLLTYASELILAGHSKLAGEVFSRGRLRFSAEQASSLLNACKGNFANMKEPIETFELLESLGAYVE